MTKEENKRQSFEIPQFKIAYNSINLQETITSYNDIIFYKIERINLEYL